MITFLITFFIIILFFRVAGPYLLRWAIQAFVKKTIRNGGFMNANGPFPPAQPAPEGEVKVAYVPQERPEKPKVFRGGEYVAYEEVKEK
jgi:hypothetical protein